MAGFFDELRRRNVFRVAALYVVTSWLVLQVADVLLPNLGAPDWAFRLVLGLLVLAFPLVVIFTWIFELTPEGLKRDEGAAGERPAAASAGSERRINVLIVIMLALVVAVVVADRLTRESGGDVDAPTAADRPSIEEAAPPTGTAARPVARPTLAVLPFLDLSPDQDQAYLSDGLAEELLNLLARVPELRVASRTSAFSFKDKDLKMADLARELNVAHILEGSVRKSGDQVRITAQLIDAARDTNLWSGSWNRTLEDVFAIQDEIAAAVVTALRVTLLDEAPTVQATDPAVYTQFLRAGHFKAQGTQDGLRRAIDLYREVLATDPGYVPAWLGLSVAYSNLASLRFVPHAEAYPEVRAAAERALAIDPDNADAYAMLAFADKNATGNYAAAAAAFDRALALDPNNFRAMNGRAFMYRSFGRLDEAMRIQRQLIERDPVSAGAYFNLGLTQAVADDLDGARMTLDDSLALNPGLTLSRVWRGILDCMTDEFAACLGRFEDLSADTGNELFGLIGGAMALPSLERPDEGAAALAALEQRWGRPFAYVIATIHADQGRPDRAFEWLDRAYELDGSAALVLARVDPMLRSLHGDPRWQQVLRNAGLSDEQAAAVALP